MKVLSNYNYEEGVEILMEIADDLQEIMTNKEVSVALDGGNFMKIGTAAYKNCKGNVEKIFKALKEQPVSAIGYVTGISKIILDIVSDPAFKDFFTFVESKDTTQRGSVTENTEAAV